MKKINTYKTFVNEGVDKMTPKSQEELLNDSPNFTELYSDVKHWTKRYKDVVVSDIEFNIYGHVCYAFFKIIVDGTSPVQEYDQTYDKNVLMVICYSDDQISLLLKKKHVYEWETISHYTEFTEVIKEMNKLRTINESVKDKMTPKSGDELKTASDKYSPKEKMLMAIETDNEWLAVNAIESGLDVNDPSNKVNHGWTFLMAACELSRVEIVKILLNAGMDVNDTDDFGNSPLGVAHWNVNRKGMKEVIKMLRERGATMRTFESLRDKMTPRHMDDIKQSFKDRGYDFGKQLLSATYINDVDSVEPILDLMYDVYTTTDSDDIRETITENYITGLDFAVEDGSCEMVELYLSYNIPGVGMSHLQNSLYNYNTGVMELLYDRLKDGMNEEERKDTEAKIADKRMNESVRDKMTPKSKEDIRELVKKKIGTDKDIITVRFYNPVGDEQWTRMRKQLKNKLIKIEVINNSYSKVTGDVIDVYEFMVYYMGFGMSYTINFINREMVNESLRDKMTPKSKEDIESIIRTKMNKVTSSLTMYPMKINDVFDRVCELFGEQRKDVFIIHEDDDEYETINEYFQDLIEGKEDITIEGNDGSYECYPDYKIGFFFPSDTESPMGWFFCKKNFMLTESLQDGLTMKPIEHITSVGDFYRYNFIEDGNEVGYIMIDNGCDLFLSSFTIWDPYKGKGLGRKYLNIILDELRKFTDYPWVGLSVDKDNEIAIKLYQSVGFRNVNDVTEYEGPGKNYKRAKYYYMVKENR